MCVLSSLYEVDSLEPSFILTLLVYRHSFGNKKKVNYTLFAPHTDIDVITFLLFYTGYCAFLYQAKKSKLDLMKNNTEEFKWFHVVLPHYFPSDPICVKYW